MFSDRFYTTDCFVNQPSDTVSVSENTPFWIAKRMCDLSLGLILFVLVLLVIPIIWVCNLFYNRGALFFIQERMGRNCKPFRAIKFRSMTHAAEITRGHDDPIELDRITPFGHFLRKTRLDELPQVLNVLKGDMSLIGPRPDYFEHAIVYADIIPGYCARHSVRPGISGLAQVSLGYIEGVEATRAKTNVDQYYIEHAGFALDIRIGAKTIQTVFSRAGA